MRLSTSRAGLKTAETCLGLGVLLYGSNVEPALNDLLTFSRVNGGPCVVEDFFEAIGMAMVQRKNLQQKAKAELDLFRQKVEELSSLLVYAHQHPLEQLKLLTAYRVLTALSKASPPLSPLTAKRFAKSAAKRIPNRDPFSNNVPVPS
jgi:O-antigen biosynthesis protein